MKRDSLVQLPLASEPARRSARTPATCSGSTAARPRRSPPCSTSRAARCIWRRAGRATRTPSAPRPPCEALLDTADEAIERAGIAQDALAAAVLAIAGIDTEAVARHVDAARRDGWIVVNDVVGAWATATGAGTGRGGDLRHRLERVRRRRRTGARGRRAAGAICSATRAPATGSASESIRAALRDRDASGPPTALSEAACAFFGVESVEALAAYVYSKPLTKGEIAAFAIETAKLAERGDAVARELFRRGAAELGEQIARGDPPDRPGRRGALLGRLPGRPDRQHFQGRGRVRRPACATSMHEHGAACARGGRGDGSRRRQPAARGARLRPRRGARFGRALGADRRGPAARAPEARGL